MSVNTALSHLDITQPISELLYNLQHVRRERFDYGPSTTRTYKIPKSPPKNIDWIKKNSEPRAKSKKLSQLLQEEEEEHERHRQLMSHLAETEPPNMERIKRLAEPLPRNISEKFQEYGDHDPDATKRKKFIEKIRDVEPKNIEFIKKMSQPLDKNVSKKFDDIIQEEQRLQQLKDAKWKEKFGRRRTNRRSMASENASPIIPPKHIATRTPNNEKQESETKEEEKQNEDTPTAAAAAPEAENVPAPAEAS